jgi:hypothetical protein
MHKRRADSKLHAVYDGLSRLIIMLLFEGQMNDRKGAALLTMPAAGTRTAR